MNVKRYLGATFALFLFLFFYEWIVNAFLLKGFYAETPHVWRGAAEMASTIFFWMGYVFILSAWLTFVFGRVYPEGGLLNGLRFGLAFGVFLGLVLSSWYLWLPVSYQLGSGWFASGLGEGIGAGIVLGAVYKK